MRPPRVGRRLRRALFPAVVLVSVLSTLVLLVQSVVLLRSPSQDLQDVSFQLTMVTNTQRETLRIRTAIATRHEADNGAEIARVHALLRNQVRLLVVERSAFGAERRQQVAARIAELRPSIEALEVPGPVSRAEEAELLAAITDLERDVKRLYDSEEQHFFTVLGESFELRDRVQRQLTIATGLSLGLGLVQIVGVRRRARSSLATAYEALVGESARRAEVEVELERTANYFSSLIRNSSDLVVVVDRDQTVREWSAAGAALVGRTHDDMIGTSLLDVVSRDEAPLVAAALRMAVTPGEHPPLSFRLRHADGSWRAVEASLASTPTSGGEVGVVINIRDMTERLQLEDALRHGALHDPLTALPNRALLAQRAAWAVDGEGPSGSAAMLLLDLDGFKLINDTHGHDAGDALLLQVAQRLKACVRSTDTVARLGGDEFAILLQGLDAEHHAGMFADRMLAAVRRPFVLGDVSVVLSASIGIRQLEDDCRPDDALRDADIAMYTAKRSGKAAWCEFAEVMRDELVRRVAIEAELRTALARDEMLVHYQPIVDIATGEVTGLEALLRWESSKHGTVRPEEFIPVLEDTGMIVEVGRFVAARAVADAATLARVAGRRLTMSINLSPVQLRDDEFPAFLHDACVAAGTDPNAVIVEVTESTLVDRTDRARSFLDRLRAHGVRVAIDDFGTGFSSLGYLRTLPVDILKIDKTFVAALTPDPEGSAVAKAIVQLGNTMHLDVVAEGVETAEQLRILRELECGYAQGFLYSPALPLDDIGHMLSGRAVASAAR